MIRVFSLVLLAKDPSKLLVFVAFRHNSFIFHLDSGSSGRKPVEVRVLFSASLPYESLTCFQRIQPLQFVHRLVLFWSYSRIECEHELPQTFRFLSLDLEDPSRCMGGREMCVTHGRVDVLMTRELLHGPDRSLATSTV
jgi:hypothetical protein